MGPFEHHKMVAHHHLVLPRSIQWTERDDDWIIIPTTNLRATEIKPRLTHTKELLLSRQYYQNNRFSNSSSQRQSVPNPSFSFI